MWQQIENALVDCKVTVDGLDQVVMRLVNTYDAEASKLVQMIKKPNLHFRLQLRNDEIQEFRDKIYKCICAMQTTLAVVNV